MKKIFPWIFVPFLFLPVGLFSIESVKTPQLWHSALKASTAELVAEVNALRGTNNLPPYQSNSILMDIAQTHADYLASTGVITHFDANGRRPYQRALDAGYSVAGDLELGGSFAENIASGANLSPLGVVTFWKGSPVELSAMLSPDFKDVGAGMAVANGLTYYVLNTGLSSDAPVTTSAATFSSLEAVISTAGAAGTEAVVVLLSTPLANGEIYHVVQKNEALWSIALAYGTTIEKLKLLNSLVSDEIFEGQTLLVQRPLPATVTASPFATGTFGIPTSTATRSATQTATYTSTPVPKAPASLESGGRVVGVIILAALLAAGLGSLLARKKVE